MPVLTEVLSSFYQDSVVLMRIAAQVKEQRAVREAAAFMGTASNKAILERSGLWTPDTDAATAEDLIITVDGETEAATRAALEVARALVAERRSAEHDDAEIAPHTLDAALRTLPDANLAVISVPGEFARFEALKALRRGLNVFLFSDNVPVDQEVELKREALARGLFCMGPDCGTAYVNGNGIGFFNVTSRGKVGCVAASGTGLQAVVSRLAVMGEGISQGIGVGGRDLTREVAGMMTLFALDGLAADPGTEVIVLISKPPHEDVLPTLQARVAAIDKPVIVCCLGSSVDFGGRATSVATLDQAAETAVAALRGEGMKSAASAATSPFQPTVDERVSGTGVLGLYTGGTLAHEAHLLLSRSLGDVAFNGDPGDRTYKHRIIDLGDDCYTVGRPHPMIAPETRTEMIRSLAASAGVGILLLDVMLGVGAHEDPARPVVEALQELNAAFAAAGRPLAVLATVVGTPDDPQGLDRQVRTLSDAGAIVFATNSAAARHAALLAGSRGANRTKE